MNTIQTALSSARFNRIMLALGVLVLAAGALTLILKIAGGNDNTNVNPSPGFVPTLPQKTVPLKNSQGVTVRTFEQLDPQVRSNIRTFLATVVPRRNVGRSWSVIAPSVKAGYTYKKWTHANALPVNYYPVDNVDRVNYYLDEATSQEILVEVGLSAPAKYGMRPTTFQLGLVPVGKGAKAKWLVNYFMPRWTPPIPVN
ncbi:MAG: hypothetical protein ACXVRE_12605 [Gaiellaceae bacterium]